MTLMSSEVLATILIDQEVEIRQYFTILFYKTVNEMRVNILQIEYEIYCASFAQAKRQRKVEFSLPG